MMSLPGVLVCGVLRTPPPAVAKHAVNAPLGIRHTRRCAQGRAVLRFPATAPGICAPRLRSGDRWMGQMKRQSQQFETSLPSGSAWRWLADADIPASSTRVASASRAIHASATSDHTCDARAADVAGSKRGLRRYRASEWQIHAAVAQHLRMRARRDVVWFHPANGMARSKAAGGKLKAMGVLPGIPDLIFLKRGQMYALEIKTDTGKLSPDQLVMIGKMQEAGAIPQWRGGLTNACA